MKKKIISFQKLKDGESQQMTPETFATFDLTDKVELSIDYDPKFCNVQVSDDALRALNFKSKRKVKLNIMIFADYELKEDA